MITAVNHRYSCREFTAEIPSDVMIEEIIRAGMQAPSAKNERPWEFLVVKSTDGRKTVSKASPYASSCQKAPVVIIVMANLKGEVNESVWWIQDIGACIQNMLLEAVEQGLGSVWLGLYPRLDRVEAIQKAFKLPEDMVPVAALPVGYPAAGGKPKDRFERKRIHWERVQGEKI